MLVGLQHCFATSLSCFLDKTLCGWDFNDWLDPGKTDRNVICGYELISARVDVTWIYESLHSETTTVFVKWRGSLSQSDCRRKCASFDHGGRGEGEGEGEGEWGLSLRFGGSLQDWLTAISHSVFNNSFSRRSNVLFMFSRRNKYSVLLLLFCLSLPLPRARALSLCVISHQDVGCHGYPWLTMGAYFLWDPCLFRINF